MRYIWHLWVKSFKSISLKIRKHFYKRKKLNKHFYLKCLFKNENEFINPLSLLALAWNLKKSKPINKIFCNILNNKHKFSYHSECHR